MSFDGEIRQASLSDAESLKDLAEFTFRDTFLPDSKASDIDAYCAENFTPAKIEEQLRDPLCKTFLALLGGQAVGYSQIRAGDAAELPGLPKQIELKRLYVRPECKGTGLAKRLYLQALDEAKTLGGKTIWLGVWEINLRAIAFYTKNGFVKSGEHIFQVGDDPQRDWIMSKSL